MTNILKHGRNVRMGNERDI